MSVEGISPSFLKSLSLMVFLENVVSKRRNYTIKRHSPFPQGTKRFNVAEYLNTANLSKMNPLKEDFIYTHTLL